jgi:beta-xylosidase
MVGRATWAYATGSGPRNLQAMRSLDQSHWTPVSDPLPSLPAWARPGRTWAPSVLPRGLGFVMYYTVEDVRSGRQCISVASAATPDGPFQDRSTSALVCQLDHGGSIDPAPFVAADGTAYLLWKSEDNALGAAPSLWSQRLSADGLGLVGTRARLLTQAASWQAGVIEGPAMTVQNGR